MKTKFIILSAICLSLQGCAYQTVSEDEYNAAKKVCQSNSSEVSYIRSVFTNDIAVVCKDMKSYRVK